MAADPRRAYPPATALSLGFAGGLLWKTGGTDPSSPVTEVAEYRRESACQTTRESFLNLED